MEIIKLKSMCDKLDLSIVCGDADDKLMFADSVVTSLSTALNALNSGVRADLSGLCVLICKQDDEFLSAIGKQNMQSILDAISGCELIVISAQSENLNDISTHLNNPNNPPHNPPHNPPKNLPNNPPNNPPKNLPNNPPKKAKLCTHQKTDNGAGYDISLYIEGKLNSVQMVHGVLLDVFGVGVMLIGDSGSGKSETALDLLSRGHLLVADDAVAIRREGNSLIGCSPALTRHLMDIRGIGIIDVCKMFGAGAVRIEQELDLVIRLEDFDEFKDYRKSDSFTLNGVSVPLITLPLSAGRNMAVLVEIGAKNLKLNAMGQNAEEELSRRIKNR